LRPNRSLAFLFLFLACGWLAGSAAAESVSAVGSDGANGAPGMPGGAGGDAAAAADAPDPENTAVARGGNAGVGGAGGDGGAGGAASASACTSSGGGDASARASAQGGLGAWGSSGGAGGDATAQICAVSTDGAARTDSALGVQFTARGGNGGSGNDGAGGEGGDATSTSSAESGGLSARSEDFARGGDGGYSTGGAPGARGGAASSSASAQSQGDTAAEAKAIGGNGGWGVGSGGSGGSGGDATAHAVAQGTASGAPFSTHADAEARGGHGGVAHGAGNRGGDGGAATAIASGSGGSISLEVTQVGGSGGEGREGADGGRGADSVAVNAATAPGTGAVAIEQTAAGGWGGPGATGGDGGHAVSLLGIAGPTPGRLWLRADADGGDGASGGAGGRGGDARAGAVGEARGDVDIVVQAIAGNGGGIAETGVGTLERVFGRSLEGGAVSVSGIAFGGAPSLVDVVGGETTGSLTLDQTAFGGSSYTSAGAAESRLTHTGSHTDLRVFSTANGGFGLGGASAASATAEVDIGNTAGGAFGEVRARGGDGFEANGADAFARTRIQTSGDGHDVWVGSPSSSTSDPIPSFTGASGGSSAHGRGGSATSESIGIASGDSLVSVYDGALGGSTGSQVEGTVGGAARSHAEGSNEGGADVVVSAHAQGGVHYGGAGGSATATATGSSQTGNVFVMARETGGESGVAGGARDEETVDAVSGSSAGKLTLHQLTEGGDTWRQDHLPDLEGGDARSVLAASNPGGGALEAIVEARGGHGWGRDGGAASVAGTAEGAADVTLIGRAVGGETDRARGRGGAASVESLFARSTSDGRVMVVAEATGGGGIPIYTYRGSGSGGDAVLVDAVDGETRGSLTLEQHARGGVLDDRGGPGRSGGSATSQLQRRVTAETFTLRSKATASSGWLDGAAALATGSGHNSGDHALVEVAAGGGDSRGANGGAASARGGDATAFGEASADRSRSRGPLQADVITRASAGAGDGGLWTDGDLAQLERVQGGRAVSRAQSRGASAEATSRATGGAGGSVRAASGERRGGRGGEAVSEARVETRSRIARAYSDAYGGAGGLLTGSTGGGGDATASATSTGPGAAEAFANAVGGAGGAGAEGNAFALAEAVGGRVRADATASFEAGSGGAPLTVQAVGAGKGRASVAAAVTTESLVELPAAHAGADGFLRAAHHLSQNARADALEGNANVASALASAEALAWIAAGAAATDRKITFEGSVDLAGGGGLGATLGDELLIGFLDPQLAGFKKLEISVAMDGEVVLTMRGNADEMDDDVYTLAVTPGADVRVSFAAKAGRSASAGVLDLVIATRGAAGALAFTSATTLPEPGSLALLALGLGALVSARRRPRRGGASPRG
jgi:hypothetical protein